MHVLIHCTNNASNVFNPTTRQIHLEFASVGISDFIDGSYIICFCFFVFIPIREKVVLAKNDCIYVICVLLRCVNMLSQKFQAIFQL